MRCVSFVEQFDIKEMKRTHKQTQVPGCCDSVLFIPSQVYTEASANSSICLRSRPDQVIQIPLFISLRFH